MPFTLAVVVVAVLASYLRGGRFARIAEAPLVSTWLLFGGLGLQILVDLAAVRGIIPDASTLGWTLLLASQLLIVAWLWRNVMLPGVLLVAIGLLLNAIVMAANGAMPVSPDAVRALGLTDLDVLPGKHTMMTDATRLPWLADILALPPLRSIISVGDIVLAAGLLPLTHALMTWTTPAERRRAGGEPPAAAADADDEGVGTDDDDTDDDTPASGGGDGEAGADGPADDDAAPLADVGFDAVAVDHLPDIGFGPAPDAEPEA